MKKLTTLLLGLFAGFSALVAQQLPISNLYHQNRMIFNPANVGDQDAPVGYLHHRQQWLGVTGAPTNQILTLQTPLGEYASVGGMVQNVDYDIIKRTSAQLAYSYGVDLALGHRLYFGLGAAYYQTSLDFADINVQDPSELGIYAANMSGGAMNFDFGVRYNWENLEVGFSANQLLNNRQNAFRPTDTRFNQFRTHLNGLASYDYLFEGINLTVTPTVLVRYIPDNGTFNDYLVNLNWNNLVWGNVGYRDGMNFIFSAGTWLTNRVSFGYSYNYSSEMLSMESFGTHEIALGFKFRKEDEEGIFSMETSEGELTEREKALMEQREQRKAEREKRRAEKKNQDKGGSKTIKIKTDGPVDEEIIIKPGSGGSGDVSEMKGEIDEINKKLDKLLKMDLSSEANRDQIEDEILQLRMRLVQLLDKNDPENVHEVSGEIEEIQKRIEVLREKLE